MTFILVQVERQWHWAASKWNSQPFCLWWKPGPSSLARLLVAAATASRQTDSVYGSPGTATASVSLHTWLSSTLLHHPLSRRVSAKTWWQNLNFASSAGEVGAALSCSAGRTAFCGTAWWLQAKWCYCFYVAIYALPNTKSKLRKFLFKGIYCNCSTTMSLVGKWHLILQKGFKFCKITVIMETMKALSNVV